LSRARRADSRYSAGARPDQRLKARVNALGSEYPSANDTSAIDSDESAR
jgi:hypothetical protein